MGRDLITTERLLVLRVCIDRREVWTAVPSSWRWTEQAPCRGLDPNMFVTARVGATPPVVQLLCPPCPVRGICEAVGRATRSMGWWGGILLEMGEPKKPTEQPVWSEYTPRVLTPKQVDEICRLHQEGVPQNKLATDFGVSEMTICRVLGQSGKGMGKGKGNVNASKTHCPAGHPYTEANTYIKPGGGRRCRKCLHATIKAYRKRKRLRRDLV